MIIGPTPSRLDAATPSTSGPWLSRRTGPCAARARTSGWSGCRPRRATWPPSWTGTWPTTWGLCHTCSGPVGSLDAARPWVWDPSVGRATPARRRHAGRAGPGRTAWVTAVLAGCTN